MGSDADGVSSSSSASNCANMDDRVDDVMSKLEKLRNFAMAAAKSMPRNAARKSSLTSMMDTRSDSKCDSVYSPRSRSSTQAYHGRTGTKSGRSYTKFDGRTSEKVVSMLDLVSADM